VLSTPERIFFSTKDLDSWVLLMGLSLIPRWRSSPLRSSLFEGKGGVLFAVFLERERHIPCWFGTYRASWTLASIDEIDAILL
jgi:hypothetical protein